MEINRATPNDIPQLCELLYSLFSQETEYHPDPTTQTRGLSALIHNSEKGDILIAREKDKVVGMLSLQYTISTALGDRVALLEDMVVSPKKRGLGIGSRLLNQALTFAKSKGCKRITLLTDLDNESAHRFYQRQGFSRSTMIPFRMSIGHKNQ